MWASLATEARERTRGDPGTRKHLFQNVAAFVAGTWIADSQDSYDLLGVAEHHLDEGRCAEGAVRLRAEELRSIWMRRQWKAVETPTDLCNDGTGRPMFWHLQGITVAVVFAHLSTGEDAHTANHTKLAQILKFTPAIRTQLIMTTDFKVEPVQLIKTG